MSRTCKWLLILLAALLLIVAVLGSTFFLAFSTAKNASSASFLSVNLKTNTSWRVSHRLLTGTRDAVLNLGDEECTLQIDVVTEEGTLDLTVEDGEGAILFFQHDIPTGSFTISARGKVYVIVTADRHRGSFSVSKAED